jgi:Predicted pPIWI-associating nuclease
MQGGAAVAQASTSPAEQIIINTLAKLVPSAAQSYQQAVIDLADNGRVSFRGPAHELRENLREALDQIAPDDAVMSSPNFKLEAGRPKPTMKQKVRFIFRARDQSTTESAAPEGAINTIDALIADMTRSIYDHGSLAAHVQRGRRSVEQLKRYVDVIFNDLLEL